MEGADLPEDFDGSFEDESKEVYDDLHKKYGIKEEELETTMKVLKIFEDYPEALSHKHFHPLRKLGKSVFITGPNGTFYKGETPDNYQRNKQKRIEKRRKQQIEKKIDQNFQNKAKLRKERIAALEKLAYFESVPMLEASKKENEAEEDNYEVNDSGEYYFPKSCYTCKTRFFKRHQFYDRLCPPCAELNWTKRNQRANLTGRVALLTGGRVKIGFRCGLKLLRDGATVVVTTRFPQNAAQRYLEEPDSHIWKDRLFVYALDMRDLGAVVGFTEFFKSKFDRLDIIVNNAAQTVRRPSAYYKHLLPTELEQPNDEIKNLLLQYNPQNAPEPSQSLVSLGSGQLFSQDNVESHTRSVILSQVPVLEEDLIDNNHLFPEGKLDVDKQQLDLRTKNSWVMKLEEVPPIELVEVHCVNVLAPFILNSRLKSLMVANNNTTDKYIINVSAMEGKFYRYKTPFHPHTNMAKAGLNMMTATCAEDFKNSGIYMSSVDTGWIHDENPFEQVQNNMRQGFQTPIDEEDAAARILDPIYSSIITGVKLFGKFYKDFTESPW